jgi:hypothetical protein
MPFEHYSNRVYVDKSAQIFNTFFKSNLNIYVKL